MSPSNASPGGELYFFSLTAYPIIVVEMRFETGDEKFKELETGTFVGAGHFVIEKDKPIVVEYKISRVVAGK